jgi:hypothetical protein
MILLLRMAHDQAVPIPPLGANTIEHRFGLLGRGPVVVDGGGQKLSLTRR